MNIKKYIVILLTAFSPFCFCEWKSGGGGGFVNQLDGELILTIWNRDNNRSLAQDLGITTRQFMTGKFKRGSFSIEAEALEYLGEGEGEVYWNVMGTSTILKNIDDLTNYGFFISSNETPLENNSLVYNPSNFSSLSLLFSQHAQNLSDSVQVGIDENAAYLFSNAFSPLWLASGYGLSQILGYREVSPLSTYAIADELLSAWAVGLSPDFYGVVIRQTGVWDLDLSSGHLHYTAVPLPAAAWLFLSALVGLMGFRKRY